MRNIFKLFIILSITFVSFSNVNNNEKKNKDIIKKLNESKKMSLCGYDYTTADYFLENVDKLNDNVRINEILLLFPDVKLVEKKIDMLNKIFNNTILFVLEDISQNINLKNRSYQDISNKIKNIKNIKIIKINVNKLNEPTLMLYLDNNIIFSSSFFKEVLYPKYLEISNYKYVF